ncbi:hypothetical protein QFC19_001362 [Naganishia cerealis]|uniref:Uncharacterized protein n=1 Tax=Naganishia cerealis TaxID=610337 RepID=A0ACC2WHH0_9TREE|nr:hypothetical protein QFC19_001362 [Naganishia cerealis]
MTATLRINPLPQPDYQPPLYLGSEFAENMRQRFNPGGQMMEDLPKDVIQKYTSVFHFKAVILATRFQPHGMEGDDAWITHASCVAVLAPNRLLKKNCEKKCHIVWFDGLVRADKMKYPYQRGSGPSNTISKPPHAERIAAELAAIATKFTAGLHNPSENIAYWCLETPPQKSKVGCTMHCILTCNVTGSCYPAILQVLDTQRVTNQPTAEQCIAANEKVTTILAQYDGGPSHNSQQNLVMAAHSGNKKALPYPCTLEDLLLHEIVINTLTLARYGEQIPTTGEPPFTNVSHAVQRLRDHADEISGAEDIISIQDPGITGSNNALRELVASDQQSSNATQTLEARIARLEAASERYTAHSREFLLPISNRLSARADNIKLRTAALRRLAPPGNRHPN